MVVSGLGQLGTRYLQGLAGTEEPLNIWGVDPDAEACKSAAAFFERLFPQESGHSLHVVSDAREVPSYVDLAISSTTADIRPSSLSELLNHTRVEFLILEKILAQSLVQLDALQDACSGVSRTWVNFPRRLFPSFRELKAKLQGTAPLIVSVDGRNWGLSTSGLHFIDLLSWWSEESVTAVDVEPGGLNWWESKRHGFLECSGSLTISFSSGSRMLLRDSASQANEPWRYEVRVQSDYQQGDWTFAEYEGESPPCDIRDGVTPIQVPRLSEFAGPLVHKILTSANCELPDLESVVDAHKKFLQALIQDFSHESTHHTSIPIT